MAVTVPVGGVYRLAPLQRLRSITLFSFACSPSLSVRERRQNIYGARHARTSILLRQCRSSYLRELRNHSFPRHRALVVNFSDRGYRRVPYRGVLRGCRLTANLICHIDRNGQRAAARPCRYGRHHDRLQITEDVVRRNTSTEGRAPL